MGQLQPIAEDRPFRLLAESGLSHSQIPIWIGQKLHSDSPLYNMTFAFVFGGPIDPDAFREAWRRVIAGSDVLRTSIGERDGVAVRRVCDPAECDAAFADFSGHEDPEGRFLEWARERCSHPLPLERVLVDSVLAKLAENRYG